MAQGPALGAAGPPAPTPSWNKEFLSKHKGPKASSQSSPNPMGIKACAAHISSKTGCLPYFVGQKKLHSVGEPGRGEVAPGLILTLLQRKRQPRPDRAEKSNGCNPKSQFSGSKIGSIHPNRSSGPDSQLSFSVERLGRQWEYPGPRPCSTPASPCSFCHPLGPLHRCSRSFWKPLTCNYCRD